MLALPLDGAALRTLLNAGADPDLARMQAQSAEPTELDGIARA
jgi:hypothetical protein